VVKELTLKAEKHGKSLFEILEKEKISRNLFRTETWKKLMKDPSLYTGRAKERTRWIVELWKGRVEEIRRECETYRDSLL
jgi:hypothetical protein